MFKHLQHIIVSVMLLFSITQTMAQIAMPDTVCVGTNRIYQVNNATVASTYTWKIDGVTQTTIKNAISITWNTAGTFLLAVQEHPAIGCDGDLRSGLVTVYKLPVANAGADISSCLGKNIQLNGSGGAIYKWSPATYLSNTNIANPVVISPPAGNLVYLLTVKAAGGCTSLKNDTIIVKITPAVKIFAGNDSSVAINQPIQLNATDTANFGFNTFTWSPVFGLNNPFIQNPVAIVNRDITYIVTARTANGCEAKDDIKIQVFDGPEIYVPNTFTPNGDGLNDVMRPILIGIKELKYFTIFNRYGQLVFTTSRQGEGWNGIFKDDRQNSGAFTWIAEAIDFKGRTITRKGILILIR